MYAISTSQFMVRKPTTWSLILFSIVMFLTSFGDGIMSFMAPNIIETKMNNELLMGCILSFSSMVGYGIDVLMGAIAKERPFFAYLVVGILFSFLFPLFMLSSTIATFIMAMMVWGIYYECFSFAKSNYIHRVLPHDQHDLGWAVLNAFGSLAYLTAPIVAVYLSGYQDRLPLMATILFQMLALTGAVIFRVIFKSQIRDPIITSSKKRVLSFVPVWLLLQKRLWPIFAFIFCLWMIDTAFWTVGALLVDDMKDRYASASFLYAAYLLPTLLVAPLGIKLSRWIGKKRTAFTAGILAGLVYSLTWFIADFNLFLGLIGLGSIALAIATPEIHGAVEDYCERLGESSNSLVGLVSSIGSLAYIIGPIAAGFIATVVGDQRTMAVIGMFLTGISLLCIVIVPRKIRLPQKALAVLE